MDSEKKNQFSNNQNQKAKHVISNNELVLSHMYRPAGKQKSHAWSNTHKIYKSERPKQSHPNIKEKYIIPIIKDHKT